MPIFYVSMKCQLEGVTDIEAAGDDFQYQIKVKCNSCNEVSNKWQYVAADESVEMPGSRGTCNYLAKCKLCNRTNSLDVLTKDKAKYTFEDVPKFKKMISFECRGLSLVEFKFGDGWSCKGIDSPTVFSDICLDEDWCDYDDEAKIPVGISEIEYKIS